MDGLAMRVLVEADLTTGCGCVQRVWIPYPAPATVWLDTGHAPRAFTLARLVHRADGPIYEYRESDAG